MASKNTSQNGRQEVQRSNRDITRWLIGLLLFFTGLFVAASVIFSFFSWDIDQSGLLMTAEERELMGVDSANGCGWLGARLGRLLVDDSFGFFGIILPMVFIWLGLSIIWQKIVKMNHTVLSLLFIMVLGSLTFGFLLGENWSVICASGWGGDFGINTSNLLRSYIGSFGMVILLLGGWILTGVFINRNFINTVNSAGNAMVDGSGKFVEIVKQKVTTHTADTEPANDDVYLRTPPVQRPAPQPVPKVEEEPVAEPVREMPVEREVEIHRAEPEAYAHPEPQAEPPRRVETLNEQYAPVVGEEPSACGVQPSETHPVEEEIHEEESPFVETDIPEDMPEEEPAAMSGGEDIVEVDLTAQQGRIVMGRGGLVELSDSPQSRMAEIERRRARHLAAMNGNPFTEVSVDGHDGCAAEREHVVLPPRREKYNVAEDDFVVLPSPTAAEPVGEPFVESEAPQQADIEVVDLTPAPVPESEPVPHPSAEGLVVSVETRPVNLVDEKTIPTEAYDPMKDLIHYQKPPVTLLENYQSEHKVSDEEIFENKTRIEETLKNFGIPIQRIKATVGPTVTLYEIVQAQGVKISKIQGLENDIAQSIKALGIRIIAPIPGRGTIGIEVPNHDRQVVSMYSAVCSRRFQESKAELPVVIGRTIQNENYVFDLAKMPHLLVAGATGQGKSVGLNAIITSLLYRKHPAELKFVMIDPKMVEFSLYSKIERHFLAKMESEEEAVVTDATKAVNTLNSLCVEMGDRLELCKKAGAKNIVEYNEKFVSRRLNPEKGHRFLPYIVVVVDEFADLIMTAREVETPVMRLAQKARAVGIHLIIATQRPDVKVITGGIKANFPARIAFRVTQMIDSRTIIDQPGANQLIGRGDMLFSKDGDLTRIQCALVETEEVERIVDYISRQQGYTSAYMLKDYTGESGEGGPSMGSEESGEACRYDSLFAEIARDAVANGMISTSMIQRNYEVGFNRAGRIMTQLERAGIVGRKQGAKPRDILFHDSPSLEAKLQDLGLF